MIEKEDNDYEQYYSNQKNLKNSSLFQEGISPFSSKKYPIENNMKINESNNFENSNNSFINNKNEVSFPLKVNDSNKKIEFASMIGNSNIQYNGNNILNSCCYLNQQEDGKYYEFKRVFLNDEQKDNLIPKNSTLISKVLDFLFNW